MFEQRVLSAYKKKLASERTEKLLQELDDEKRLEEEKKAQKASKAAKKRDRERQKKLANQEAKAKKEAERAAEEAAKKLEAEKRAEEQRKLHEEKRKAKEAQKKKEEDERQRKEAERLKRVQEQERKAKEAREAKEREKRLKEEQRQKEKEAREAKERQERERKEREQRERQQKERLQKERQQQKERDARERREKHEAQERERKAKEAQAKGAREAKDKAKGQSKSSSSKGPPASSAAPKTPLGKKQQPSAQAATPQSSQATTNSLTQHHAPPPTTYASPKVPVATPIIPPRTAHPIRSRTSSQQHDVSAHGGVTPQPGAPASLHGSPHAATPIHASPGTLGSQINHGPPPLSSLPHTGSPSMGSLRGVVNTPPPPLPPFGVGRGVAMPPPPPGFGQVPLPPGLHNRMTQDQMFPPSQAGFRYGHDLMQFPPGFTPSIIRPPAYGGPPPPPGFPQVAGDPLIGLNHAFSPLPDMGVVIPQQPRQLSGSLDPSPSPLSGQAIIRPAPIGRPSSVVHGQRSTDLSSHDVGDEEQEHLGSRALLDDDAEDPISLDQASLRRGTAAPGPNIRTQFPPSGFMDTAFGSPFHTQWGSPSAGAFSPQPTLGNSLWSTPGAQFGGAVPPVGQLRGRPPVNAVTLRHMLCQACQSLSDNGQANADGYVDIGAVKANILQNIGHDVPDAELLAISETEGNVQNGGGSFDSITDSGRRLIRWVVATGAPDKPSHHPLGAPGDIGSPIIGGGAAPGAGRGS